MSKEPRFINNGLHPVYVSGPDGHQITVRPFRELGVIVGRRDEDCIVTGEFWSRYPGLLIPFPEPVAAPAPKPAQAAPEPAGPGLGLSASGGVFKGTGDVLTPGGQVKKDAPTQPVADGGTATATEVGRESAEPESLGKDDNEDRPLADIPGMTKKLAAQLRKAGFETALAIANCQTKKSLKKLAEAMGSSEEVASALIDRVHTLLDWE